ncbi:DMT family transporter [candidate division KSB1 bacterium]|nr:DMT family transporter [candidate division KSB1 bacterium]
MNACQKAVGLLVITSILWSFGGLLIKLVAWHPLAIAGMRSLIAATFLLFLTRRWHFTWSATQIGAAIAFALMVLLFVAGNKLTTAANMILIQYTAPIYIALFSSWFLKEKVTSFDWVILSIVMAGLVLFFVDELTPAGWLGNVLALLSGVCLAWLFLLLRRQKETSTIESIILGNILAGIIGLPFMFQSAPSFSSWVGLLVLGVVQLGFPYWLVSIAIKNVNAMEAILIPVIEPILNPIWVLLIMGERPGPWSLLGGAIVLFAISLRGIWTIRGNAPDFSRLRLFFRRQSA